MTQLFLFLFLINIPIQKIDFLGNQSVKGKELSRIILSRVKEDYSDVNLIHDANRIVRYYYSKGFIGTKVAHGIQEVPAGIEITFNVNEGSRPRIRQIVLETADSTALKKLLYIGMGNFFIQEKIVDSEDEIEKYYKDRGYAFADISSSIVPDSGRLAFEIEKGRCYYIRRLFIKGLKGCNPGVVRREVSIKSGEPYSRKKLQYSQRQIYSLGFFSSVEIEIMKEASDSLDLVFSVRELKSRLLNFGLGLSLPLSFLFSFGIEELNLFNAGHRFKIQPSFEINIESEWEAKIEARYIMPYITPARLTPSVLPFYWHEDQKNYLRKSWGAEFRISKIYSENIQANIANKYKKVDFRPKEILPDTLKGVTNSVELQVMMDYRNEFFNPRKGLYLVPLVEYAGGVFGGSNNFLRFEVEERFFLSFIRRVVIANRIKIGYMYRTGTLSVDEKYSLGGQYTLRGYPDKCVGPDSLADEKYGEIVFSANLEKRMNLIGPLGTVIFLDGGYVDNEINFSHKEYIKYSWGFGLRYNTPIGPVRADIGFPLRRSSDLDPKQYVYLGIYHIF